MIAAGTVAGFVDILGIVDFFELQDFSGMKTAMMRVFDLKTGKESRSMLAEPLEGFPDRLDAVADFLRLTVEWLFTDFTASVGIALVRGDEFDIRAVDENFMVRGFERENVADVFVGNGITIGLKLDKAIDGADAQKNLTAIIRVGRKWLQTAFLFG